MLVKMSFGAEGYSTRLAPKRLLEIVDVHVQPQLARFTEYLIAHDTLAPAILQNAKKKKQKKYKILHTYMSKTPILKKEKKSDIQKSPSVPRGHLQQTESEYSGIFNLVSFRPSLMTIPSICRTTEIRMLISNSLTQRRVFQTFDKFDRTTRLLGY